MHWRLHTAIFADRMDEAVEIISKFGDTFTVVSVNDRANNTKLVTNNMETAVLGITTIQDTKNIQGIPGLYYHKSEYRVSFWLPNLDNTLPILNKSAIFLPSGLLLNVDTKLLLLLSNDNKLFIRPDSGNKLFTGHSISINNWEYNIAHIQRKLDSDSMVLLSSHIQLSDVEWRCWIVNNRVVASSPYTWDDDVKLELSIPDNVLKLATSVAQYHWQIDYSYVLDIVLDMNNNPFINEINATSTSGIYQVPLTPLLTELRALAICEYNEYITLTQ